MNDEKLLDETALKIWQHYFGDNAYMPRPGKEPVVAKEFCKYVGDLIKSHTRQTALEARIDERELGKADVVKLREVYITHDIYDPRGDRAIAIRNHLRDEIVKDFDVRIATLKKTQQPTEKGKQR